MANGAKTPMEAHSGCFMVNICSCAPCFGDPPIAPFMSINIMVIVGPTLLEGLTTERLIQDKIGTGPTVRRLFLDIGHLDLYVEEAIGTPTISGVVATSGDIDLRDIKAPGAAEGDPTALVEAVPSEENEYGLDRFGN